jgi:hypothetical protein
MKDPHLIFKTFVMAMALAFYHLSAIAVDCYYMARVSWNTLAISMATSGISSLKVMGS